jgi:putative thioredoxin
MSHEVTDFQKDVVELSASIPVVVDFWAEWCGPCKVLGPVLERLAERHKGEWALKKVDTEAFPDVATRYGIRSIPNVKLFVDGKPVHEFVGALPEQAVEAWLARAIPDKNQKALKEAEDLIREGKGEEALLLLEPVVATSPENEHARALLAMRVAFSDPARARELVTGIHEATPDGPLAGGVLAILRLLDLSVHPESLPPGSHRDTYLAAANRLKARDFDGALTGFIEVIKGDRYYDDDGARKACLGIFAHLGEEDPLTRSRRREFGSALYV